ncbi:MAG: SPOR domain-containing protein [Gammaproteobacteria bacterium]|nr:SPOR domain-containing protein [Gammaproteobacteria bacterium]
MPRDYKHRARKRKKRNTLSPLAGVIGGLLIGLFVAFLVYLKMQGKPDPHVYLQQSIPAPAATVEQDVREVRKEQQDTIPPPPKPRFDFYTLLPEMEVVIPEQEITAALKQPPPPAAVAAPVEEASKPVAAIPAPKPAPAKTAKPASGTFYLQVGSFRNSAQAERFKAELAMQGMQTSIQTVTINNKDTYHRVRVGPFHDFDTLDKTRQSLKKKGIDSTPIKVTG